MRSIKYVDFTFPGQCIRMSDYIYGLVYTLFTLNVKERHLNIQMEP